MIYYRYWSILNSLNLIWMGQKSLKEYTGIWHCLVLFTFESLLNFIDFKKSNMRIFIFFSNYLVGKKTHYSWNGFTLSFFSENIGVGQGLALSSILSALFIAPILHIFEKRIKNLNIPVSFLSFIDNGLFISQEKLFINTNTNLFCSYNIMSSLLD